TGENALPEARNEKGEFVYMGRVIEHPEDYVEEHYDANQYHGQDGLGQYIYGYKDWNQGKMKRKTPMASDWHLQICAASWPSFENPPTKTPAVLKAEEEHFKAWGEFAAAAGMCMTNRPICPGPEETGEPKGFFYTFDYNVPLLRNKQERAELEQLRSINNKD
ncbi:hypothetical protein EVAR_71302_1, partial [Eumeta japonica]